MENITFDLLKELRISDWQIVFSKHKIWSLDNKRLSGEPQWHTADNALNVIGVRFNTEVDFNYGKYNDFLMLDLSGDYTVYFETTTDPNRNKWGIAHLRQGCWNSYVIRPHKWDNYVLNGKTIPRWAICQDKNEVEVARTDGNGKVIETERGFFGINIHNPGIFKDSSAGCTILKSEESYRELFLPALVDLETGAFVPANPKNITYTLINIKQLETYL